MSIKSKDKILTYEQARELKWFCQNVMGVRQDMYSTIEKVEAFDSRIKRLEDTCISIEKFLGEKIEPRKPYDWSKHTNDVGDPSPADKDETND